MLWTFLLSLSSCCMYSSAHPWFSYTRLRVSWVHFLSRKSLRFYHKESPQINPLVFWFFLKISLWIYLQEMSHLLHQFIYIFYNKDAGVFFFTCRCRCYGKPSYLNHILCWVNRKRKQTEWLKTKTFLIFFFSTLKKKIIGDIMTRKMCQVVY